jgi:hypothetical protein
LREFQYLKEKFIFYLDLVRIEVLGRRLALITSVASRFDAITAKPCHILPSVRFMFNSTSIISPLFAKESIYTISIFYSFLKNNEQLLSTFQTTLVLN